MRSRTFVTVGKFFFWVALVSWTGFGLWNGVRGTAELLSLHSEGKYVNAQVTGYEPLPKDVRMGYVHYAFNAGSRAIDNRFPYPVQRYVDYPIGAAVPVTFLPGQPHSVRMGRVDMARVGTTAVASIVFVIAGLLAFGLPLFALSGAKRQTSPR